jgi:hypothetical protein
VSDILVGFKKGLCPGCGQEQYWFAALVVKGKHGFEESPLLVSKQSKTRKFLIRMGVS